MKKKYILILFTFIMLISESVVYASMADYTDEQADAKKQQEQLEWNKKMEERVNKSSNNYLKSLSVKNYEISPSFDKQTINYEIKKGVKEDYIEIEAETDDDKSSVSGNGRVNINSGENNVKIEVTAENGTVRSYFIKVIKGDYTEEELENNKTTDRIVSDKIQKNENQESIKNNKDMENNKITIIIIINIIVVLIIVLIIFIKYKK